MTDQLKQYLNEICSYLSEGMAWHKRCANQLRKMPNRRGYARVHDGESECDAKSNLELSKLIQDNLNYSPVVDGSLIVRAESYAIQGLEGFKQHFRVWTEREKTFLKSITAAIDLMRTEDIEIYQYLCALSKEVKCESIRAEWIYMSLEDVAWQPHHMAIVSKYLHEQAEANPGSMDFNIG